LKRIISEGDNQLTGDDLRAEFFRINRESAYCVPNLDKAVDIVRIVQDYGVVSEPPGRLIYNIYCYLLLGEMPDGIKN